MGRGRQKAKDAKIARQLKYSNHGQDIRDLERELLGGTPSRPSKPPVQEQPAASESDDLYDRWATDDED